MIKEQEYQEKKEWKGCVEEEDETTVLFTSCGELMLEDNQSLTIA